jgi:hypothetical protein
LYHKFFRKSIAGSGKIEVVGKTGKIEIDIPGKIPYNDQVGWRPSMENG